MFLKTSRNSQEKGFIEVFFLLKLQDAEKNRLRYRCFPVIISIYIIKKLVVKYLQNNSCILQDKLIKINFCLH